MSARRLSSCSSLRQLLRQHVGVGDALAPQHGAAVVDADLEAGLLQAQVLGLEVVLAPVVLVDAVDADDHRRRARAARSRPRLVDPRGLHAPQPALEEPVADAVAAVVGRAGSPSCAGRRAAAPRPPRRGRRAWASSRAVRAAVRAPPPPGSRARRRRGSGSPRRRSWTPSRPRPPGPGWPPGRGSRRARLAMSWSRNGWLAVRSMIDRRLVGREPAAGQQRRAPRRRPAASGRAGG